jgi:hypothetical protein
LVHNNDDDDDVPPTTYTLLPDDISLWGKFKLMLLALDIKPLEHSPF